MLDHPITQKVFATVAAASFIGVGGAAWTSSRQLQTHDQQLKTLEKRQTEIVEELKTEVRGIGNDVGDIKTDVAVIKERTKHYDEYISERPRP